MPLTQQNRIAAIDTPLGTDVLCLVAFSGHEELGRMFQYEVELYSDNDSIEFDDIIGQNVTVSLTSTRSSDPRYFNGYISRFTQMPSSNNYAIYRATIVPWLWFLTRTSDCRIWSGADKTRTVPEILAALFGEYGFADFENKLTGNYTEWDFCVQYRETDFNFVSRIMEQEGIYYYFKHENKKHTLVLTDAIDDTQNPTFPGYDSISFKAQGPGSSDLEYIRDWTFHKEFHPAKYVHKDFDFQNPKKDLTTEPAQKNRQHAQADLEIYDYPGEYTQPGDGKDWAQIRIDELQTRYHLLHGSADARGIVAGCTFELEDLPRDDQNQEYLVVSVAHSLHISGYETGNKSSGGDAYHCSFTVIATDEVFRPARITPKPLIQGPQTAIVVGPDNVEIHTDPDGYGQVKLKFHWDRYSKSDGTSSCWIRVSHAWAGKGWGAIYLPRVGQEVIVEFLEGDPDCPIVTGRVYNDDQTTPYTLPDEKTKSTLKSNSSTGGQGFNEIRFEDKAGSEQIFIHGEKDEDLRIKNDSKEWIGNDRHLIVVNDQVEQVQNDKHSSVSGNKLVQITGKHNETIQSDNLLSIAGADNVTVTGDRKVSVGGDENLNITGNWNTQAGQTISIQAGTDITENASQNYCAVAGMTVYIKAGTTLVLEAGVELSLKAGGNFIDIGPAGVSISGTMVMINSGGSAASGSAISPTSPTAPDSPTAPNNPKVADDSTSGQASG